jgi:fumarylacetoacetate (FAA) hydrolase
VLAAGLDGLEADGDIPLDEGVRLWPPIPHPPSMRDSYAFEQHARPPDPVAERPLPPAWYEIPGFYFSDPAAVYGSDDAIPYPADPTRLDYELEVAAVSGPGNGSRASRS